MQGNVELRKGEYYVAGTRVPLACVIQKFLQGASPQAVCESYPLLTVEQVSAAIAYYLDHQPVLDEHFSTVDKEFLAWQIAQTPIRAELRDRLERARQHILSPSS